MGEAAVLTNLQKFSVHDGPGIRSILFLKGCPLRCQWCANPENIGPEPELMVYGAKCIGCGRCVGQCSRGAIAADGTGRPPDKGLCVDCGACAAVCPSGARVLKGVRTTAEEARRAVDRDVPFYKNSGGGITFSGGEPLLHPDFIVEIARGYRAEGLNTAVETCGCVPWQTFEQVLPWIDLFLFDLKIMDSEKHCRYCGMGDRKSTRLNSSHSSSEIRLKRCIACLTTTWGVPNMKPWAGRMRCGRRRCPRRKIWRGFRHCWSTAA